MSEDPPPPYFVRKYTCSVCGKEFEPGKEEAEALAAMEAFGLKAAQATVTCEDCEGRRVQ